MKELSAVKIGRAIYRVKYRRLLPRDYACIRFKPAYIYLDDATSEFETADSLLHEILHGIWCARKLPDRPVEESAVTQLAAGLGCVFRDNPGLLHHLEALVKEAR